MLERVKSIQRMIVSSNGVLKVSSAYVNLITLASLLNMSTQTTERLARYPIVKAIMLFSACYSVVPEKLPCVIATLLFFIFEVKHFMTSVLPSASVESSKDD